MDNQPTAGPGRGSRRQGRLQENAEAQRQRILSAAIECFAWNGYMGTTISAVAAKAGLSHGLVHHYFASKADLYTAAVQTGVDYLVELRQAALAGEERPPDEQLRRWMLAYARVLMQSFFYTRLVMQVMGSPGIHPRECTVALGKYGEEQVRYAADLLMKMGIPRGEAQNRAVLALSNLAGARFLIVDVLDPESFALRMYRSACETLGIVAEPLPDLPPLPPTPARDGDQAPWKA